MSDLWAMFFTGFVVGALVATGYGAWQVWRYLSRKGRPSDYAAEYLNCKMFGHQWSTPDNAPSLECYRCHLTRTPTRDGRWIYRRPPA